MACAKVGQLLTLTLYWETQATAPPVNAEPPRSGRGGRRFKSCHSDQFSRHSDSLRDQIWGTKLHAQTRPCGTLAKQDLVFRVGLLKVRADQ
jgi:hypothetical protein